jgi:hypothetical protein
VNRFGFPAWLAVAVCVAATPAWAQFSPPAGQLPPPPPQLSLPPGYPLLPFALPTPPAGAARRGPITITPSVSVTGEYNDNVFQNNANKVSDFILGISPGVSIALESPIYRLLGSYSFTAEIYADQSQLNDAFSRHNFQIDGAYRLTPLLTVSLTDTLLVGNDTNVLAAENVSTGRTQSLSNTLSSAVAYQLTPRTTLRGRGAWTALRYDSDAALDSDTYAFETFAEYAFTPRLIGAAGYQFAFFDIQDNPWVTTHTPRVGASYRFTETLTGSLSGGPSIQVPEEGDTSVFPAITATLQQRFAWGSASLQYDHSIATAGGLGGTTENQSLGAVVQVDRVLRGLIVQLAPRYTRETSTIGNSIEVDSFSLTLQARYEINRFVAVYGGYTYFMQRSDSVVATSAGVIAANDVDQNRVFLGLQFGYPIKID